MAQNGAEVGYRVVLGPPMPARIDRENTTNTMHRHNFFELSLVRSGRGTYRHGSDLFDLAPGDAIVSDPDVVHEIAWAGPDPLLLSYTTFTVRAVEDAAGSLDDLVLTRFMAGHHAHRPGHGRFVPAFDFVFGQLVADVAPMRATFARESLHSVILNLLSVLSADDEPIIRHPGDDIIADAIAVIETRLAEPLPPAAIATAIGISVRSLHRAFALRLGRSVGEEVRARRVRRAASLLGVRELSIAEVGRRVGIDDAARFSTMFTRRMHVSPRAFRRSLPPAPRARGLDTSFMVTERLETGELFSPSGWQEAEEMWAAVATEHALGLPTDRS